jgi:hypothetical protein
MELDLQSLFRLLCYSCAHGLRPRNLPPPPTPAFGLIYEGVTGQQETTSLCNPLGLQLPPFLQYYDFAMSRKTFTNEFTDSGLPCEKA